MLAVSTSVSSGIVLAVPKINFRIYWKRLGLLTQKSQVLKGLYSQGGKNPQREKGKNRVNQTLLERLKPKTQRD